MIPLFAYYSAQLLLSLEILYSDWSILLTPIDSAANRFSTALIVTSKSKAWMTYFERRHSSSVSCWLNLEEEIAMMFLEINFPIFSEIFLFGLNEILKNCRKTLMVPKILIQKWNNLFDSLSKKYIERKTFNSVAGSFSFSWNCPWRAHFALQNSKWLEYYKDAWSPRLDDQQAVILNPSIGCKYWSFQILA